MDDIVLKKYQSYLKFQRNYSEFTIASYLKDVELFYLFLSQEGLDVQSVDTIVIRNYITSLLKNNISKRTIKRKISSLKNYYRFLKNENIVSSNPFLLITTPKVEKKYPDVLYEEQVIDLLNALKNSNDKFKSRDIAIISLLYYSGLRAFELVNLDLFNFNFSNRTVRVFGKGRKERIVPFSSDCLSSLLDYKNTLRKVLLSDKENSAFFLNNKGERLTTRGLEYILDKIEEKSGLFVNLHPHLLRHTFATKLLDEGADLRVIQELLGHASISATQIYTHVSTKKMNETFEMYHPHSKKNISKDKK
ncbi:MAG: site-specific tyrosine recombinase/integron integrase [Bacilli bacterium]